MDAVSGLPLGHNIVADVASIGAIIGVFEGFLPDIATIVTIVYFSTLLFDRRAARRTARILLEREAQEAAKRIVEVAADTAKALAENK